MESLNTRTDVEGYLEKYPEEAALFLRKTLAESKGWVLVGKLADGEPDVAEASRKSVKVFDQSGALKERYLYEYKEDPGSKLFRLGFSVKEVEVILLGLGVDLEAVGSEQEVLKTAVTEKWTAIEVQAAAQAVISNDPEKLFNVEVFQESLLGAAIAESFSSDSVLGEFDKLIAFVTGAKKFALLKQYLQWRVSKTIITVGDYAVVAGLLLAQNINLENY